jgi:hypothetical protein
MTRKSAATDNIFEVFFRDPGDRDVKYIRPFLSDEKQQQVERAGKIADLYLEVIGRTADDLGRRLEKIECKLFRFVLGHR